MKTRNKTVLFSTTVLALSFAVVALSIFNNGNNLFRLTNATAPTDYTQTLVFDASNISAGSGSVTVNGNTFNYSNVAISGNNLVLGAGAQFTLDGESGDSISGEGMVGGSFTAMEMTVASNSTFEYELNGEAAANPVVAAPGNISVPLNTPYFDLTITSGSVTASELRLKYSCVAPAASKSILFMGADSYTSYDPGAQYGAIMESLGGNTVTSVNLSSGSYTINQIVNYSSKKTELVNDLAANEFDTVVVQISRRMTKNGDSGVYDAEKEAFKTLVDNYLLPETGSLDSIYIYAPAAAANQSTFKMPAGSKYAYSSDATDSATAEEQTEFYNDAADDFAAYAGVKAMHYSSCYLDYSSDYTQTKQGVQFLHGCVFYSTFFNRIVPAANTYTAGASNTLIPYLRNLALKYCVE